MLQTITLKDDFTFLVSDTAGEVTHGSQGHGLYFQDTRYLSCLELSINEAKPQTLSYHADYNIAATFHQSSSYAAQSQAGNSAIEPLTVMVSHGVSLIRRRLIRHGLIENLEFTNYHNETLKIKLELKLGADFADIFIVRGFSSQWQGQAAEIAVQEQGRVINFNSIPTNPNLKTRQMRFEFELIPDRYEQNETKSVHNDQIIPQLSLFYTVELKPNQPYSINMRIFPEPNQATKQERNLNPATEFAQEAAHNKQTFIEWQAACTQIETNSYPLHKILEISTLDLRSLMQQKPQGLAITAGLPWYFTLFGRDSLLSAIQTLSLNPQIALDTMRVLAAYQADKIDDWRDSEPGKILHELRYGDMTLAGEVPHGPYYGSIDSTLLYIICFAQTLKWLDDPAIFAELWPSVEKALHWATDYGDADGDGYIEFKRRSPKGILHQGWKDSDESMGGAIGPRPSLPIALVEVQGYYYAAQVELAVTLRRFGNDAQHTLATQLEAKAAQLKTNFNRDFWWETEHFFVQALDGEKKPICSVTSNPGHCLWNGIIEADKAPYVVRRLMQPDMLSGWGIRTMSTSDPNYNPMSYHNGSIWPHDNSLILAGLRRYGFDNEALQLAEQLMAAAMTFADFRLPELYCGWGRNELGLEEHAPAAYPVSCSPQAWAAGTPILMLQALLGLDVVNKNVKAAPVFMTNMKELTLRNLRVGHKRFDLCFERDAHTNQIIFTQKTT